MKQHKLHQALEQAWEQSVERAAAERTHAGELDADQLNQVAGLHVESGIRAGGWTDANSCITCSCSGCHFYCPS